MPEESRFKIFSSGRVFFNSGLKRESRQAAALRGEGYHEGRRCDGGGVGNRKKDNRVHCRRSDWLHDGKMGMQKNMESKETFSCEGDFYQIPAMGDCAASYIPVSGCG